MTKIYPGNGFIIDGNALIYAQCGGDNVVIKDTKQPGRTFIYGYDGLKQLLADHGYELMRGDDDQ